MKLLGIVLALSAFAFGQGVSVPPGTALKNVNGTLTPVAGATITVCAVNTSGTPCYPALVGKLFLDAALTQPLSDPFTADANGNYSFSIAPGTYTVSVTAPGFAGYSYQISANGNSGANNTWSGTQNFTGSVTFSGQATFAGNTNLSGRTSITAYNLDNIIYVDGNNYSQADVFASANAAAGTFAGPGKVVIPPGTYSTASTLNCANNIEFSMSGVTINYTGTGSAISIKSVNQCKITGPLHLVGTKASGTVGIYLGNPTANAGLTTHNEIDDVVIGDACAVGATHGFGVGVIGDANVNSGTYYNVLVNVASNGNLNQGWLLVPTSSGRFNSNRFLAATACSNGSEGFKIDGSNFNVIEGIDSEDNGTYGINFPGAQSTGEWTIVGGDLEGNTTADVNFGGGTNVADNTFIGFQCASTTCQTGWAPSLNNIFEPGNSPHLIQRPTGSQMYWGVGAATGTGSGNPPLNFYDSENSAQMILGIVRTGTGAGNAYIGTTHYPAIVNGGTPTLTIASGTAAMTTAAIAAGACGSTVTVAASGVLTTDVIDHSFNASVGANPGVLTLNKWPTANNVNFAYCNPTASSVTPSAATINWRVPR